MEHITMSTANNNLTEVTNNVDNHTKSNGCTTISQEQDCTDNNGFAEYDALTHPHNIVSLEELCLSTTTDSSTGEISGQNGNGSSSGSIVCPNHAGNELKYYCSHCETAVCETCTQVSCR